MFFGSKKTGSSEEKEMKSAPPKKVDPHYLDDEPEVDYDVGPTQLYKFIEGKQWDKAINRIESHPHEAKTWVFRREPANPKKVR